MSQIFDIADRYVEKVAEMSPLSATYMGVPGYDHRMNDFSPEASDAEAELDRATLAELEAAPVEGNYDRIAREAMMDSLRLSLDRHDANERYRSLSMIFSPIHSMRQVFDLMPRDTEEAWSNIASRMALIPDGVASYRRTLEEGLERGLVVAKRQATETADQCDIWNGSVEGHQSFFEGTGRQLPAVWHRVGGHRVRSASRRRVRQSRYRRDSRVPPRDIHPRRVRSRRRWRGTLLTRRAGLQRHRA